MELTKSCEDYLKGIWELILEKGVVRVKDLAKHLNVKMPSVVTAIKILSKKGLVKHERYGYIELTKEGESLAESLYKKHQILYKFFKEFLGLKENIAKEDACKIEHYLNPDTMERFIKFIEFVEGCPLGDPLWILNFHYYLKTGKRLYCVRKEKIMKGIRLSELKPGEKLKVLKVNGEKELKKRLLDMGVLPGVEIEVEKISPLGFPVDIKVRGYHLSLRKEEAEVVVGEKL